MKRLLLIASALLTMVAALSADNMAYAQWPQWSQATACPGWNNPNNFGATYMYDDGVSGAVSRNCYSGQTGSAIQQSLNVSTQATGVQLNPTVYLGTQLANVSDASGAAGAQLPNVDRQFYIHTTNGYDPNTLNRLPYIPSQSAGQGLPGFNTTDQGEFNTQLTRSIRIGDGCGQGKAAALYYEFVPNVDNAVFIIYYAVVVQGPEHGDKCDPSFVIRVMEKNASNQWVQKSDTLAYYVTSTCDDCTVDGGCGGNGTAHTEPLGVRGWHLGAGSGSQQFKYKDWEKVVVNLGDCLDEPHRIEIIMRDCAYTAHTGYAYVCGECRPMAINNMGYTPDHANDVTTLQAPRGMMEYEWQASEYGYSSLYNLLSADGSNNYFTFRTLSSGTEADSAYNYHVQVDDFRVSYRPVNAPTPIAVVDSFAQRQTFRCNMKSALNPDMPFWQPLYVDVTNTREIVDTIEVSDTTAATDTIEETQHDTVYIILHDTVFIHDTIFVHDTIVVGIGEAEVVNARIYLSDGYIVVDGAEGKPVRLYDDVGRLLATKQDDYATLRFEGPASGAYLVKVGDCPARRVIVVH